MGLTSSSVRRMPKGGLYETPAPYRHKFVVRMRCPSGERTAVATGREWPCATVSSWPVLASQRHAVLSSAAVITRWPSGEKKKPSAGPKGFLAEREDSTYA